MTLTYPVALYELGNGLCVVASEDHAAPTATVHVHYDAGSRHEAPGRTGLAHLFEHLFFEGSARVAPGEHARLMQSCGAVFNGGTAADLTVYFEHLPAGAADLALWLEADRMATHGDRLTQELLDAQRAVITQEKHQRCDNVPYGNISERMLKLVYPPGHPYHHPVIGSLADLESATLEEVAQFFRRWYVPGNAVLAVTGDITPEQVFTAAEEYFGAIPARDEPPDVPAWVLDPAGGQSRDDAAEAVPFPMTVLGFRLPPNSATDPEILACDLALRVAAGGTPSRAHERLVRELQAAQQVQALTEPRLGGNSLGTITVPAMPGADAGAIEKELLGLLDALAATGPHEEELARAQAAAGRELLATVSSSQGRAFNLAFFTAAFGDPDLINTAPDRIAAITPGQVQQAAARWLRPDCAAIVTTRPALPGRGPSTEE